LPFFNIIIIIQTQLSMGEKRSKVANIILNSNQTISTDPWGFSMEL